MEKLKRTFFRPKKRDVATNTRTDLPPFYYEDFDLQMLGKQQSGRQQQNQQRDDSQSPAQHDYEEISELMIQCAVVSDCQSTSKRVAPSPPAAAAAAPKTNANYYHLQRTIHLYNLMRKLKLGIRTCVTANSSCSSAASAASTSASSSMSGYQSSGGGGGSERDELIESIDALVCQIVCAERVKQAGSSAKPDVCCGTTSSSSSVSSSASNSRVDLLLGIKQRGSAFSAVRPRSSDKLSLRVSTLTYDDLAKIREQRRFQHRSSLESMASASVSSSSSASHASVSSSSTSSPSSSAGLCCSSRSILL